MLFSSKYLLSWLRCLMTLWVAPFHSDFPGFWLITDCGDTGRNLQAPVTAVTGKYDGLFLNSVYCTTLYTTIFKTIYRTNFITIYKKICLQLFMKQFQQLFSFFLQLLKWLLILPNLTIYTSNICTSQTKPCSHSFLISPPPSPIHLPLLSPPTPLSPSPPSPPLLPPPLLHSPPSPHQDSKLSWCQIPASPTLYTDRPTDRQ